MDNFNLKKFLGEKSLLKENAPGYDTRKTGEALPTLEGIKAAFEAKNNIKEGNFNNDEDVNSDMAMGQIFDLIRQNDLDAEDVLEEIGQEFNIAFEFGRASGLGENKTPLAEGIDIKSMKSEIDDVASYLEDEKKEAEVMNNVLNRHDSDPFETMGEFYAYLDGYLQKYQN
jgi:hypothetical protein